MENLGDKSITDLCKLYVGKGQDWDSARRDLDEVGKEITRRIRVARDVPWYLIEFEGKKYVMHPFHQPEPGFEIVRVVEEGVKGG